MIKEPMKFALADAVLGVSLDNTTPAAIARAKQLLLYHSWLAFFGERQGDPTIGWALSVLNDLGPHGGPCTIVGQSFTRTAVDAAYLNAHLMRGAGYDDVVFPSGMHAGILVFPTAIALSEQSGVSGRAFLSAVIVGYEVLANVGRWSWSSDAPRRPSSVFGPMAVAATAALLLGLDREQTATALGYAAHGAIGLPAELSAQLYGMMCRIGIESACFGKAGGTCASDILEGELGFYRAYFDKPPRSREELLGDFGKSPGILKSREKRYPGTLLNTVAIEQARSLINAHGLIAENVARVHVILSDRRARHPTAHLQPPFETPTAAAGSCPFQIALLLLDGDFEPARYEAPNAPEILRLCNKIRISFADRPNPIYARVEIEREDGARFVAEAEDHIFEPLDPRVQLEKYAASVLGADRIAHYIELVDRLEDVADVRHAFKCLAARDGSVR